MNELLLNPKSDVGLIHEITPTSAGWKYVGMSIYVLEKGQEIEGFSDRNEIILVIIEGKALVEINGISFGSLGERMNVFEKSPPHSAYAPNYSKWKVITQTNCSVAICSAPAQGTYRPRLLPLPKTTQLGVNNNTRFINNIAMEEDDVADSLLVTEVFTPQGNWSSYPPHRHDEDDFPNITYLEETYYHRFNPEKGYGFQRIWTDDETLDKSYSIKNHQVVLVPKGYHPCGVSYGYEMYYLNVMAGPIRK